MLDKTQKAELAGGVQSVLNNVCDVQAYLLDLISRRPEELDRVLKLIQDQSVAAASLTTVAARLVEAHPEATAHLDRIANMVNSLAAQEDGALEEATELLSDELAELQEDRNRTKH